MQADQPRGGQGGRQGEGQAQPGQEEPDGYENNCQEFNFQVNLHIYGPQVIVAANTFCMDPTSKIAKETFENFCDMWRYLVNDVIQVAKEILESFKSFSLLEGANTSATSLKTSPSNRTYSNSVFQNNRDPFSSYPPRTQHRLNTRRPPGPGQLAPAPILTNANGPGGPRHGAPMGQGRSVGYMDTRGHPDTGMGIQENGVRWSGDTGDTRLSRQGPGHSYPAGECSVTLQCCSVALPLQCGVETTKTQI